MEQIKDKDKLWIIYYAAVGYRTAEVANRILENVSKLLSTFDDSVISIIVPIEEGNSRVEFYNLEKAEPMTSEKLKELMNYAESETI